MFGDDFQQDQSTVDHSQFPFGEQFVEEPRSMQEFAALKLSGKYVRKDAVTGNLIITGEFQMGKPSGRWKHYNEEGDYAMFDYVMERVGALCRDGTHSSATGRGACSWHGGVAQWLYQPRRVFVGGTGQFQPIQSRHKKIREEAFKTYEIPITRNQKQDQWKFYKEAIKRHKSAYMADDIIEQLQTNNNKLENQLELQSQKIMDYKERIHELQQQLKLLKQQKIELNPEKGKQKIQKNKEKQNQQKEEQQKQQKRNIESLILNMNQLSLNDSKKQESAFDFSIDFSCQYPETREEERQAKKEGDEDEQPKRVFSKDNKILQKQATPQPSSTQNNNKQEYENILINISQKKQENCQDQQEIELRNMDIFKNEQSDKSEQSQEEWKPSDSDEDQDQQEWDSQDNDEDDDGQSDDQNQNEYEQERIQKMMQTACKKLSSSEDKALE